MPLFHTGIPYRYTVPVNINTEVIIDLTVICCTSNNNNNFLFEMSNKVVQNIFFLCFVVCIFIPYRRKIRY